MKLDSLAKHLHSLGNCSLSFGRKPRLFINEKPANAKVGAQYVILYADLAGASVDDYLPNYHKTKLQLVVSAKTAEEGFDLASALSKDMTVNGLDLSDIFIVKCSAKHLPVPFKRNEQDLIETSVNFDLIFRTK